MIRNIYLLVFHLQWIFFVDAIPSGLNFQWKLFILTWKTLQILFLGQVIQFFYVSITLPAVFPLLLCNLLFNVRLSYVHFSHKAMELSVADSAFCCGIAKIPPKTNICHLQANKSPEHNERTKVVECYLLFPRFYSESEAITKEKYIDVIHCENKRKSIATEIEIYISWSQ